MGRGLVLALALTACNSPQAPTEINYPGQPEHCAVYVVAPNGPAETCWKVIQGQPPQVVSCNARCRHAE